MNESHDPNRTVDVPSDPADSLDAGLAAGFGRPADGPGSVLSALRPSLGDLRPVLLREAQGESSLVVKPKSDAMPSPEQSGDRYQLSGEIARGGMGAVLRGRDVDLGRDLAVKVLLEKHAHRPEVARRFVEEAQIGGQLQHPGIVPVYDIGCFGKRPFFTMKLVKGKTLAHLLAERADYTQDRPHLLGIALKVAQTLAYAHAKGVIHRDLKPANIMVGSFGEVQVMDWGLAKVLAEGGVADEERASRQQQEPEDVTTIRTLRSGGSGVGTDTEAGSLLGTPAYMPPEQANGDVALLDRRADVFGLGAILCEILTGKAPYVGRSAEEVRRKAANGDLADAHARLEGCGADPELITLTKACLAPEAIDRPKDAQAVAEGLTAYLDGVQERLHQAELAHAAQVARTEAAQETAAQERKAREAAQARAVAERQARRLTLALAGTVLLALTLGGGGWLYLKTQRDVRQAQLSRDVNEAVNKATAFREQARTASAGSAALFAQAREQAQRAVALVESGPADDTLKDRVRQLQAELDEEEKDRRLIAALDEARMAPAEALSGLRGKSGYRFAKERAVPKFREAFRAYGLAAGKGEPKATAERIRQRPTAVREAILAALDEWDELAGDKTLGITEPHREWLQAVLETAEPDDAWGRKVRAARRETDAVKRQAALEALAKSATVAELPARALTRLAGGLRPAQAAELLRRAQRHYPADFWVNSQLGEVLQEVMPPEREEAVRFLTAAVALRPESPGAHLSLVCPLKVKGQLDEAIACCRKAIALDPKLAAAHCVLGYALGGKGQLDEAQMACFKKAIELDPKLALAHNNLADVLANAADPKLRDPIQAVAEAKEAIELDPKLEIAWNTLGEAYYRLGKWQDAITALDKGRSFSQGGTMGDFFFLAMAHHRAGHKDQAQKWYDRGIAWMDKHAPKDAYLLRDRSEAASVLGVK
jgi:tetratricopeptide (TPR) repeat protein